jgi:SAM-dependent methyltransferase
MKPPLLFDQAALALRRARMVREPAAFLLRHVAEDAAERLATVTRAFPVVAEIGSLSLLPRAILLPRTGGAWWRLGPASARPDIVAREDALPLAEGRIDLALSLLALQFVDDLPGALLQMRRALRPDGLFLAALVGGGSLGELRQAFAAAEIEVEGGVSPRVSPFVDVRDLGGLLQRAGFALPVTDSDTLTVRYDDVFGLMRDLRAMGATNVLAERRRIPSRRATLLRMAEIYRERFADPDGRVRATFEIVWASGWAPDASQPKPLRPGSATMRLADALGVSEKSTGGQS